MAVRPRLMEPLHGRMPGLTKDQRSAICDLAVMEPTDAALQQLAWHSLVARGYPESLSSPSAVRLQAEYIEQFFEPSLSVDHDWSPGNTVYVRITGIERTRRRWKTPWHAALVGTGVRQIRVTPMDALRDVVTVPAIDASGGFVVADPGDDRSGWWMTVPDEIQPSYSATLTLRTTLADGTTFSCDHRCVLVSRERDERGVQVRVDEIRRTFDDDAPFLAAHLRHEGASTVSVVLWVTEPNSLPFAGRLLLEQGGKKYDLGWVMHRGNKDLPWSGKAWLLDATDLRPGPATLRIVPDDGILDRPVGVEWFTSAVLELPVEVPGLEE